MLLWRSAMDREGSSFPTIVTSPSLTTTSIVSSLHNCASCPVSTMSSKNPPAHSCRHCQRIVLRRKDFAPPDDLDTSRHITLPHTAAEIRKALEDECVFFMCFFPCSNSFNHFDATSPLTLSQRKSNLVRTVQAYRPKKKLDSTLVLDPLRVKFCHGSFSIVVQRTKTYTKFDMLFLYEGHSTLNGGIQMRASLGP